jgi:hypothetical protein
MRAHQAAQVVPMDTGGRVGIDALQLGVQAPGFAGLDGLEFGAQFRVGRGGLHQPFEERHQVQRGTADEQRLFAAGPHRLDGLGGGGAPARRVEGLAGRHQID